MKVYELSSISVGEQGETRWQGFLICEVGVFLREKNLGLGESGLL